jgi:RHS repeat-associated protein
MRKTGGKVIAEYLNGSLSAEYIYLGGKLLATHSGTTLIYHHRDLLSVRVNTDGTTGAVVGDQGHYPYGEVWYSTGTTSKYLFTSYERDPESSNDYALQRYNANRLGRFMSPDPVMGAAADPQSLNRFSYVANDPINGVDPNGTDFAFLNWPFDYCVHHPRWDDNTEFWLGHLNICPFLPWLPFIRELRGGGPRPPCVGPGTKSNKRTWINLCNEGDTFFEEWQCPIGCNQRNGQCSPLEADYTLECNARGKAYYALCSTGWTMVGSRRYCHCCISKAR